MNMTEKDFKELKRKYTRAITQKQEVFLFKGEQMVVEYAKYLIGYLEPKFKNQ